MRGAGEGSAAPGGILTTWLIRALPPRRRAPWPSAECRVECPPGPPPRGSAGRAVLLAPGFLVPAPHGHSLRTELRVVTSAAASRVATRTAVALCSRLSRDALMISFMVISARWFFLPSDRSETAAIPRVPNVRRRHARVLFHKIVRVKPVLRGRCLRMRSPTDRRDLRPEMLRPWPSYDSATKRKDLLHSAG